MIKGAQLGHFDSEEGHEIHQENVYGLCMGTNSLYTFSPPGGLL